MLWRFQIDSTKLIASKYMIMRTLTLSFLVSFKLFLLILFLAWTSVDRVCSEVIEGFLREGKGLDGLKVLHNRKGTTLVLHISVGAYIIDIVQ